MRHAIAEWKREATAVSQQASRDPQFMETFAQHEEIFDDVLDQSRAAGGPIDLDRYEAESLSAIRSDREACYRLAEPLGIENRRFLNQMAREAGG